MRYACCVWLPLIHFMGMDLHEVLRIYVIYFHRIFIIHTYACISFHFGPLWEAYHVVILRKWPSRIEIFGFMLLSTHLWFGEMGSDTLYVRIRKRAITIHCVIVPSVW